MNACYGLACWTLAALVFYLVFHPAHYLTDEPITNHMEATLKPLRGQISDRLRKLFGRDDPGWQPGRPGDVPPKAHRNPPDVEGHGLGGRNRKDS